MLLTPLWERGSGCCAVDSLLHCSLNLALTQDKYFLEVNEHGYTVARFYIMVLGLFLTVGSLF